jgi:LPS sulfotransferase NodH
MDKLRYAVTGSDPIFIVGRQRSGTTVFRELLKVEGAYDCDEIFHGDLTRPNRFYAYVLERVREDPKHIHPERHGELFREFIKSTNAKADGKPLAIDVKYFGLNLIPAREDIDGRQPFIFNYLANSRSWVVHIIRKNKLRIIVSEKMAQKTAVWSAVEAHQLVTKKPKLRLECDEVIPLIRKLIDQDEHVERLLKSISNLHSLIYEEMFSGFEFSKETMAVAESVMGRSGLQRTPRNLRMNPEPLTELIENFEDVIEVLKNTEFAWMLEFN